MLDLVVDRRELKPTIARALRVHGAQPAPVAAAVAPTAASEADDVIERLFALEQFGIKLGLDNIRTLLAALGHPQTRLPDRPRRRHQRQRIGHGHGRARACAPPVTAPGATRRRI